MKLDLQPTSVYTHTRDALVYIQCSVDLTNAEIQLLNLHILCSF